MVEATPRKIPLMSLAGLGIVIVAGLIALLIASGVSSSNRWADHSVQVQTRIVELGERLATHDGALRGYMISREPAMRDDMRDSRHDILLRVAELRELLRDNEPQLREIDAVAPLIRQRLIYGEHMSAERDHKPLYAMNLSAAQPGSLPLILAIRQHLGRMFATESALLAARQKQAQQRTALLSIGLVATVLLVVVIAYLTISEAQARSLSIEAAHREARAAAEAAESEMRAREQVEEQLRHIQKMESIGQLTGGIAHDFNNMLAVVIGSLDMARRRIDDPDRLQRSLASAMEGAGRAASLVSRLLAYSRRQSLAPAAVDPNRLVGDMSNLLGRTLGEGIEVETELAGDIWPTFVDPLQLENAIVNLAVNARDALGGRGRMTIRTGNATLDEGYIRSHPDAAPGDYVMIMVRDFGSGMPPDVLARAFDPFFTTKGVGRGTGLGLSQVFGFVKQSGGHIGIESVVGHGTTIRLFLPRHEAAPAIVREPAPVAGPAPVRGGERILLVEDDDRVRQFSRDAVADLGYVVTAAPDGVAALALIEQSPDYAILFTDVVMPGMGGTELAAAAREKQPNIRILYTTGYAHEAIAREGLLEPGVDVLLKPFTVAQLAQKLRDVLDKAGPDAVQAAASGGNA
ncbi:response regulator [Sphingomonas sp. AP4-R1]|uniref:response regulator n=1 Tax=Sphingomonas sp. AP4-R1 TaxID=2735134 RepID=UPI0014934438|nr:response regulator [Sphingomonas sp. AP4-R1]QJU56597.1 response regulator [Sphingomonas sp. AP4-R1]